MNILRNGSAEVEFTWIGEDLEQLFIDTDSIVQAWAKWIDGKKLKGKKRVKKPQ